MKLLQNLKHVKSLSLSVYNKMEKYKHQFGYVIENNL
jgi:hypothetical protein